MKRYGKFSICTDFIVNDPEMVKKIFSNIIIVRAECNYINKTIDYEGISDLFDEIDQGEMIPEYRIIFNKENDSIEVEKLQ